MIVQAAIGAYDYLTIAESVLRGLGHSWLGTRQVEVQRFKGVIDSVPTSYGRGAMLTRDIDAKVDG